MDSIRTTIQNPASPTEPIVLATIAEPGETIDALILRHADNIKQLKAVLLNPNG